MQLAHFTAMLGNGVYLYEIINIPITISPAHADAAYDATTTNCGVNNIN